MLPVPVGKALSLFLYEPSVISEQPVLARHNVFVSWDAHRYHAFAPATSQVVEPRSMTPVP